MAATRLALLQARIRAWNQAHPDRPLDGRAVVAVAAQEGLGGGIGDQGTSFGPFQLHYRGAYPSWAPQGREASQAWAWSPQGIDYALRHIAGVAGGQRGGQAVASIVTHFERPANIPREIARATAAYGGVADTGGLPPTTRTETPSLAQPSGTPSLVHTPLPEPVQSQPQDLTPLILGLLARKRQPAQAPTLSLAPTATALPLAAPSAPAPTSAFRPFPKL